MSSKNDFLDYHSAWLAHYGVKGMRWKHHKYNSQDGSISDYDGLSLEERKKKDSVDYLKFNKMTPKQQKAYIKKMRARQMKYIDDQTKSVSNIKTKDGRYDIRDRIREQVTGKMDGDNIERRRKEKMKKTKDMLVSNNRWGEELEATHTSKRINKELQNDVRTYESKTVRGRIRKIRKKGK